MRALIVWSLLLLAGCDGQIGPLPEARLPDENFEALDGAVELDAGAPDAGEAAAATDAGVADGGVPDSGTPDAGVRDAGLPDAGPTSSRQTPHFIGTTDAGNGFYEYLPPGYGDGELRPLLVFWHGIGENGNGDGGLEDLRQVLRNGPPKLINQDRWSNGLPFVVLSAQHRGGGCPSANEVRDFIAFGASRYDVDPKRLYLTGLSCGAIGSWSYLADNLDAQVAAAVLIAGDPGDPNQGWSAWGRNMCNLGRVPLWSFHGSDDTTVYPGNDRATMTLLIGCPQPPRQDATYTEYPGIGHDSWTATYDLSAGHDPYSWLLQHAKP